MEKTSFDYYSSDLENTEISHLSKSQLVDLRTKMLDGDKEAWHTLWLYGTKLVLKICNSLRNANVLSIPYEEAVAEGNLAIGEALTRWEPRRGAFGTWVWLRTRSAIIGLMGRENAAQAHIMDLVVRIGDEAGEFDAFSYDDEVFELQETHVENRALYDALLELPEREREVIIRRFFEDKSQQQIADLENVSRQMIDKVERRGLDRLKNKLSEG